MSEVIIAQNTAQRKYLNNDKFEVLSLADDCLQRFNEYWAAWLASGDDTAFRLALAAKADREALLELRVKS